MIRVRQIKINVLNDKPDKLKNKLIKKLNINENNIINYKINRKSIDARDKSNIFYVYELDVNLKNENKFNNFNQDIIKVNDESYKLPKRGKLLLKSNPIIIGSGPAGLFCAYMLATYGYKPIIIERGECIEKRENTVNNFFNTGILNEESNIQFGEGGAGTFSDGKLNTQIKDKNGYIKKVLDIFVKNGASEEISYVHNPHIGTDKLKDIIINMRKEIIKNGGKFLFEKKLTDIEIVDNKIKSIVVDNDKIDCDTLILAIGHSAYDTFKMLYEKGIIMHTKPFAVGVRVQHLQDDINYIQYGRKYKNILPAASYKLTTHTKNNRGVYTFCMCPGGYVVNASSLKKRLAINGMSYHKRDSKNANSAVIVTVNQNDFGNNYNSGIDFQKLLEEKAYNLGQGKIPVQLYKDYKNNIKSSSFGKIKPLFKGQYEFANIRDIFPDYINDALIEGIENMSKKIPGFNDGDTILSAVESRTSSPIRIDRNENMECNIRGIYPIGEGAGYSGGITSSAVDGIKAFEKIYQKYCK